MNFPLYKIVIDENDDSELMTCISLVKEAAVETDFLVFNKQKQKDDIKLFTFENNELEHKIKGVAIRADYPIYRCDNFGNEYYVMFDKKTIETLVLKYSKMGMNNLVSLQHDGNLVDGVYMIEYFIKDTKNNIVPKGFEEIEDGSLFCTYLVENESVWQEIINHNCNGFSIEVIANMERVEDIDVEIPFNEEDYLNSLINELLKDFDVDILFADDKKKLIEDSIKEKKPINIKLKGSSKIHNGFVYSIFDVDGSNNIALYDYTKKEWELINLTNIEKVNTNSKSNVFIDWQIAQQQKGFTWIQNIIENATNVKETALQPTNFYEDIIMNKKIVMLKYSDGDGRCETYRQCLVCEYGTTRAGNRAIRAYEYSGASHGVLDGTAEIPDWRCFLISRITDIKLAPEGLFKPITQEPPGFNPFDDKDGFVAIIKAKW